MNVLLIEDERPAAQKLIGLIRRYDPSIEILDEIDTVEDAVEWFQNNSEPDLLFLDIHLADGLSFEIFEQTKVSCPIIFTTAYDQYAIQAFKTKSVDYLLKPIKYPDLEAALNKFREIYKQEAAKPTMTDLQALAQLLQDRQKIYKTRFLIKTGNIIKSVPIEEVAYFCFEDRLTLLVTKGARRYPINHTLDELEEILDPQYFYRVNRQFIIHFEAIHKIHPYFKGRLKLDLIPPQNANLVVSADKSKYFREWLDR